MTSLKRISEFAANTRTDVFQDQRCYHDRAAICWRCALDGEGPAWWKDVPGYGTNRWQRTLRDYAIKSLEK